MADHGKLVVDGCSTGKVTSELLDYGDQDEQKMTILEFFGNHRYGLGPQRKVYASTEKHTASTWNIHRIEADWLIQSMANERRQLSLSIAETSPGVNSFLREARMTDNSDD